MNEWMNNPAMQSMDPMKMELIRTAAAQTQGKSGKALAPVMMALITNANKKGIQFTPYEFSLFLSVLTAGKATEEQDQIENMVRMVSAFMKK